MPASACQAIWTRLESALGGASLAQVLVTHGHSDHASGAPAIAARMPSARFLKYLWPGRDQRWDVPWVPIAGDDRIEVGETTVTAVHTAGHAPDHLCFWHAESRTLFGGDLAIEDTTVWIPSSHEGDLARLSHVAGAGARAESLANTSRHMGRSSRIRKRCSRATSPIGRNASVR